MAKPKFSCTISPEVEEKIIKQEDLDIIADFFISLKESTSPLKDYLLVFLPGSLKSYITHPKLKTAWSILQSGGSQSIFSTVYPPQYEHCESACVAPLVEKTLPESTARLIINFLHDANFPIILSNTENTISKLECSSCIGKKLCGESFSFSTTNLPSTLNKMRDLQKEMLSDLKKSDGITFEKISEEQLRMTIFLMCVAQDVPHDKIHNVSNMFFTSDFLSDIRNLSGKDVKNISYCSFRAATYPPLDDRQNACEFSIDWHQESPKEIDGIPLFRCDVVEPNERGKIKSGSKRVLLGNHDGLKVFLAYSPDHDFDHAVIKERINKMKNEVAESRRKRIRLV
ncbi:hypothetical protein EZJ49_07525 [Bdellovibrio bacteriovorus]|uniref:hypothetical protein n=1 Tax=Bdellovibrio bacteriovorus TaxID=959 RepID=UPI0021D360FB|nr:hypothetical protein [Bdellovibrio bacteriovorus]UXR66098.1 hypothetical protein EZJ49_07525 [Bdellovibrio bacteriovorus]